MANHLRCLSISLATAPVKHRSAPESMVTFDRLLVQAVGGWRGKMRFKSLIFAGSLPQAEMVI